MRRIGELLVAEGSLTEAAVARALHYQRMSGSGARLGTILLNWDLLAEEALIEQLARLHRCEPVPWPVLSNAPAELVRRLPAAAAIRLGAVPYALEPRGVRVAFLNPSDLTALDESAALLGKRVFPGVTSEVRLFQAHHKFYGRPITQETRALIYKLQRSPAGASPSDRMRTAGEVVDFRAPDLVNGGQGGPFAGGATRGAAGDSATIVPVVPSARARPARPQKKPRGLPPPPDFFAPESAPEFRIPDFPAIEAPVSGEESLKDWVGEALSSFQREALRGSEIPVVEEASANAPAEGAATLDFVDTVEGAAESTEPTVPAAPNAPPAPVNGVANGGLWRASRLDDADDAVVSDMWRGPDPPGEETGHGGHTREEISAEAVETHLAQIPRALVLGAGAARTGTVAWHAKGQDFAGHEKDIWIPAHERSIFAHVERSGAPHFGPLEPELWPRALADLTPKPLECAVFPVRTGDTVAAFLYADRLGEPMLYDDFGQLTRAAGALAASLSRLLLNSNSSATVP